MKRFIKEYANHIKREIKQNELMRSDVRDIKNKEIDKILRLHQGGLITIDETIMSLLQRYS